MAAAAKTTRYCEDSGYSVPPRCFTYKVCHDGLTFITSKAGEAKIEIQERTDPHKTNEYHYRGIVTLKTSGPKREFFDPVLRDGPYKQILLQGHRWVNYDNGIQEFTWDIYVPRFRHSREFCKKAVIRTLNPFCKEGRPAEIIPQHKPTCGNSYYCVVAVELNDAALTQMQNEMKEGPYKFEPRYPWSMKHQVFTHKTSLNSETGVLALEMQIFL